MELVDSDQRSISSVSALLAVPVAGQGFATPSKLGSFLFGFTKTSNITCSTAYAKNWKDNPK